MIDYITTRGVPSIHNLGSLGHALALHALKLLS